MKKRCLIGAALAVPILFAGACFAHGVGYRTPSFAPVALEFFYSTGEAMSYREAKVFSPSDEKYANQTGRTDAAGRFAFVPDVPGIWRVIVQDEEGHRAAAEIDVAESSLKASAKASVAEEAAPFDRDIFIRAALGVSLLFNVTAFVSLLRRREKKREEEAR